MTLYKNPQRIAWVEANRATVPSLVTHRCVDGTDTDAILRELLKSGLYYGKTCSQNYGGLAHVLCRYNALKEQVDLSIPWAAIVEDDAALGQKFVEFVEGVAWALQGSEEQNTTLVQLGEFAEGYITSLGTARALVRRFQERGILDCPEPTYNAGGLLDEPAFPVPAKGKRLTPWKVMVMQNKGELRTTPKLLDGPCSQPLRWATATPNRSATVLADPKRLERLKSDITLWCKLA